MSNLHHDQENVLPVIPPIHEHTDEHPFCLTDPTCSCHEDPALIAPIAQVVQDGLMTPEEATNYVMGKTLQGGWYVESYMGHTSRP